MNDTPTPRTTLRAVEPSESKKKSTGRSSAQPENKASSKKNNEPLDGRLKTACDTMNEAYSVWSKKKAQKETETLQEAMHELRRTLAAIEISIAMSDKN